MQDELHHHSIRCRLYIESWCCFCHLIAEVCCAADRQLDAHCYYSSSDYEYWNRSDLFHFFCRYYEYYWLSSETEILSGWNLWDSLTVLFCSWFVSLPCLLLECWVMKPIASFNKKSDLWFAWSTLMSLWAAKTQIAMSNYILAVS